MKRADPFDIFREPPPQGEFDPRRDHETWLQRQLGRAMGISFAAALFASLIVFGLSGQG